MKTKDILELICFDEKIEIKIQGTKQRTLFSGLLCILDEKKKKEVSEQEVFLIYPQDNKIVIVTKGY